MERCECTTDVLCAYHRARGEDPRDAPLFAERRWQAQQEFH